jgi:hypothetical protein
MIIRNEAHNRESKVYEAVLGSRKCSQIASVAEGDQYVQRQYLKDAQ